MVTASMVDGDLEASLSAYARDFAYHNPMLKELPSSSPVETMRQMMEATRVAFPDLRYVVAALIADGDTAAVLYTWSGTHHGALAGIPPTGRSVTATTAPRGSRRRATP